MFTLANQQEGLTDHPWWDQAALMRILGKELQVWPIGLNRNLVLPEIIEQQLSTEWNSIRQDPSPSPRIRHFAGENYWTRKLLLAEYSNSNEHSKRTLSEILDVQSFEVSVQQQNQQLEQQNQQLEQQNQQLEQQNQQLEQQYFSVVTSRIWRTFSFYRKFRGGK